MQLKDIMTRNVEVVSPDSPVQEAAEKMNTLNVGVLPVCTGEKLVGMVTDRDITLRSTAVGSDPRSTCVADVMTPDVVYCYEDQDITAAAQLMEERQIRRLPIVNRSHKLVGIISLGDLAVDAANSRLSGEVIKEVSKPAKPER